MHRLCSISEALWTPSIWAELGSVRFFLDWFRKKSAQVKKEDGLRPYPLGSELNPPRLCAQPQSFWVSVKRYVRKGIPLEHRARVWMAVSGAQAQMDQNPGYYHRLLEGESSSSLEEAIRTGGRPALTALSHVARAGRAE